MSKALLKKDRQYNAHWTDGVDKPGSRHPLKPRFCTRLYSIHCQRPLPRTNAATAHCLMKSFTSKQDFEAQAYVPPLGLAGRRTTKGPSIYHPVHFIRAPDTSYMGSIKINSRTL